MNGFMNFLQKNWGAKFFSVVGAIILWFFVMNQENPYLENRVTVPVVLDNAPENCYINYSEEKVRVKLRGKRSAFLAVPVSEYAAKIDLAGITEGEHKLPLQIKIPAGLEVVSVSPEEISVSVEPIIKRILPVSIVSTGTLDDGAVVAKNVPESTNVEISGPRLAVEKVKKVIASVPLSGSNSFAVEVPLSPVDDKGKKVKGITLEKQSMLINVMVSKGMAKKEIGVKPVFTTDLPEGYSFGGARVTPSVVTIEGSATTLAKVNELGTVPISLAGMTKPFSRIVRILLPGGVVSSAIEVTVEVDILRKD